MFLCFMLAHSSSFARIKVFACVFSVVDAFRINDNV